MAGKNDGGLIQGMDTIPKEIAKLYKKQLAEWLPGWKVDGEYNYRPGATTKAISAQLDVVMHDGSHPWINNQVAKLFEKLKFRGHGVIEVATHLLETESLIVRSKVGE